MTGVIILAAGSSSRLGVPKQNLMYNGLTLFQRAIQTATASAANVVVVVTGANAAIIKPTIANMPVKVFDNPDWPDGMASSVITGLKGLLQTDADIDAVILMLCDQPYLEVSVLDQLITNRSAKGIVACAYNNTFGAPVLFDRFYFDDLLSLKGQEGARKLLLKFADAVTGVPFPFGSIDIDTMEDYEKLGNVE